MDDERPRWQWPSGTINQIALVLAALLFLGSVYALVAQLLFGYRLSLHAPSLLEIAASVALVVVAVAALFAERKRVSLSMIISVLLFLGVFLGFLWLPRIVALVPVERRSGLEILVTVLRMAATGAFAVLLLRGVKLR